MQIKRRNEFFRKYSTTPATVVGDRQIRVVASDATEDRVGDIMVPSGCKTASYAKNPIVLADHDPTKPIGRALVSVRPDRVEALITFAPAGASPKADEYCSLAKSGVLSAVSVGFVADEFEVLPGGGRRYTTWELMEISMVAVPCNQNALVVERSLGSATKADNAWKCGASRNLPIGGDDAWDGPAAEASIFEKAGFDGDSPDLGFARKGFLAYDSANPKLKGSYKLPFAKIVDGRLTAMPSGIRAAASRLPQADIPDDVRRVARAVLDGYEAQIDERGFFPYAKTGAVLSEANRDHLDRVVRCLADMGDSHTKAAHLHDYLHDALAEMQQQIEMAKGHVAAIAVSAGDKARKEGRVLSDASQGRLARLAMALRTIGDSHTKAAHLHDYLHDHLVAIQGEIEHAKNCAAEFGGEQPDNELAFNAEYQERRRVARELTEVIERSDGTRRLSLGAEEKAAEEDRGARLRLLECVRAACSF